MATVYLVAIACVLLYVLYKSMRYKHTYWERNGIKTPDTHWFFGNFKSVFKREESLHPLIHKVYNDYPNEKVVGLYQAFVPILFIRDPELIKTVMIKDFAKFSDRGFKLTDEVLSRNMFMEDGDSWRILRQKFSPTFTSGKLKNMMPLLNQCVNEYVKYLDGIIGKKTSYEVRELNMKFTLKAITSIAFGLEIDPFYEEKSTFVEMTQKIFEPTKIQNIVSLINCIVPDVITKFPIKISKPGVEEFFLNLVDQIVKQRLGKPKVRRDLMDLMIEMKEQGTVTKKSDDGLAELEITNEVLAAQALIFYAAGFETSSGAMSFTLYELAMHQSIQDRCYEEIKQIMDKNKGVLTFDSLVNDFHYVSMVFDESLRKYPIVSFLIRQTSADYEFPELNLKLKKGIKVMVSPTGLHYDEAYFPDPEKFDPERFSPENRGKIKDCTYIPFGEGPRNCIGMRFAKVQSLLGLAHFLYHYRVKPCADTPAKIVFDPIQFNLLSKDGIKLHVEKRS